jgi:hypothetical protein
MWRIKTKKEMEIRVKKEQTDHNLEVVTVGVLFWWPHEGRNNHIHDNVGSPKLFKMNKSPHTKTVLHWLLSYCIFYRYFAAAGATDKLILSKIFIQISTTSLLTCYYITRHKHCACPSFTHGECPARQTTRPLV